tara:strand:+ start:1476 stop:1886 length:411 start_codon:yes stop_codon:yes gene_type:complete
MISKRNLLQKVGMLTVAGFVLVSCSVRPQVYTVPGNPDITVREYSQDKAECMNFVNMESGTDPTSSAVTGGFEGAVAGATLGAIIGAIAGNAGKGAAWGAGAGALSGSGRGARVGQYNRNTAYAVCMEGKGHFVRR